MGLIRFDGRPAGDQPLISDARRTGSGPPWPGPTSAGWSGITRRVPLERFAQALTAQPDDIRVVLTLD
ncbi:hypothetical protein [Planomonospora sphaerica]|uniref:hypothetical protein n=1 Tax=Planomonospora sphaerica TaxID=161355 RepID=UPI00129088EC|nr:hypothetical protein [Planomonospora sphaerica]